MTPTLTPLRTTGIGSLPFLETARGLDSAFALEIPYFPTLPRRDSREGMLAQGMSGFPGSALESSGEVRWDSAGWKSGRELLAERLAEAFNRNRYVDFLPSAESSCWEGFLERLQHSKGDTAKSQLVGPVTLASSLQGMEAEALDQVAELLFAKALAMSTAIRLGGKQAIFFWDEPGLHDLDLSREPARRAFAKLREMADDLRNHGVKVGIHCCGRADFPPLLDFPLDYLSFDSALSLESILQDSAVLSRWLEKGGRLSFGIVPTQLPANWYAARVSRQLKQKENIFPELLSGSLLTPACGLGLRSEGETQSVFTALINVKRNLDDL